MAIPLKNIIIIVLLAILNLCSTINGTYTQLKFHKEQSQIKSTTMLSAFKLDASLKLFWSKISEDIL